MKIYTTNGMVESRHIKEIDNQLRILGSKVDEKYLDGEDYALALVLYLACGKGSFGLSIEDINNIEGDDFKIEYNCKNSIIR